MNAPINPCEYGSLLIGSEERDAVVDAVRSGDLFRHQHRRSACDEIEERLASVVGLRGAVVLANGTSAIRAMLHAVGVRAGDTVLVNAFTFHATASAVYLLGANPLPVDLDLQSNVDIDHVLRLLRHRPVAVVAVHWPGRCFDLSRLKDICNQHGVLLLEDAAQAFGAHNGSAVAGGQGVAGAYSFQQGKLITCGEGGCVVSNDCEVLERVRAYSDHGMRRDDDGYPLFEAVKAAGDNLRLTGLQGALLAAQLRKLDYLCQTLAATKQLLREQLAGYDVAEWNPSPGGDLGQIFTLRFQGRAAAEEATVLLAQEDILLKPIWRRPYPELFPQRWCMEEIPLATAIADAVRAIPLPPTLTIAQCRQIAGAVSRIRGLLWP